MSIRVFGKEQQLTRSFTKVLATYARTWYTWLLVNRWVGFSLDLLTTSMLAATGAYVETNQKTKIKTSSACVLIRSLPSLPILSHSRRGVGCRRHRS